MPLTRKRATIWTCSDGKEFTSILEAVDHDRWLQFSRIIEESGVGRGGDWSPDAILNALWDRREDLRLCLTYGVTKARKSAKLAPVTFEPLK